VKAIIRVNLYFLEEVFLTRKQKRGGNVLELVLASKLSGI
jgi:hypothetical protein